MHVLTRQLNQVFPKKIYNTETTRSVRIWRGSNFIRSLIKASKRTPLMRALMYRQVNPCFVSHDLQILCKRACEDYYCPSLLYLRCRRSHIRTCAFEFWTTGAFLIAPLTISLLNLIEQNQKIEIPKFLAFRISLLDNFPKNHN